MHVFQPHQLNLIIFKLNLRCHVYHTLKYNLDLVMVHEMHYHCVQSTGYLMVSGGIDAN